jgi:hypothetical protein
MMKPMPKSPLRPGIALAVLVAGHIFASIFMRNLGAGIGEIADPWAAKIAKFFYSAFTFTVGHLAPFMAVFILFVIYRIWRGKNIQWGIDILGALLTVRCFVIFVLLNLLLLSQLRAGGLLLMQLILFLPVITLNFGWLYWRLDTGARIKGQRHIRFAEDDESPSPFDYFYIATRTLLQFEPTGASGTSRLMKALFVIHGVMMLDLVALTLSRAISLASGG